MGTDTMCCDRCGKPAKGPLCDGCSIVELYREEWKARTRIDNRRAVTNAAMALLKEKGRR